MTSCDKAAESPTARKKCSRGSGDSPTLLIRIPQVRLVSFTLQLLEKYRQENTAKMSKPFNPEEAENFEDVRCARPSRGYTRPGSIFKY
jgi:hypothetical protein